MVKHITKRMMQELIHKSPSPYPSHKERVRIPENMENAILCDRSHKALRKKKHRKFIQIEQAKPENQKEAEIEKEKGEDYSSPFHLLPSFPGCLRVPD